MEGTDIELAFRNISRREAYQIYVSIKYGFLGTNNRVRNPQCILTGV